MPLRFEQSIDVGAPAELVFAYLDDFEALGAHMMRSSRMMPGSRMRYEFDRARGRRPGARVRLLGSLLGIAIEIDEEVIERTPPRSKAWQTIGQPRMLVLEAYLMGFSVMPVARGSRLQVFIEYTLPRSGLSRWLGALAGARYARWCVRSMVAQAGKRFAPLAPVQESIRPTGVR